MNHYAALISSWYGICSNSYQGVGSEAVGQHHALPVDFKHVVLLFHFSWLFYSHPSLVKRLLPPVCVLAGDEKVGGGEIHVSDLSTITASKLEVALETQPRSQAFPGSSFRLLAILKAVSRLLYRMSPTWEKTILLFLFLVVSSQVVISIFHFTKFRVSLCLNWITTSEHCWGTQPHF